MGIRSTPSGRCSTSRKIRRSRAQLPRPLERPTLEPGNCVFTLEPWRGYILDVTICIWIPPTFFFLFFFSFAADTWYFLESKGAWQKKKKKEKEKERRKGGNKSEIEASGPWIPREWHRLANEGGFRTPYTSPFQTNWLEWKRTRRGWLVGWLVGWLARYQTRGRGWIPSYDQKPDNI